ncbi:MAG TPA: hypothetical protein VJN42_02590 [Candidatus Acidoferrum sp.]|nr:hypothetical protein [Candidatus Acidoferrum sp.]
MMKECVSGAMDRGKGMRTKLRATGFFMVSLIAAATLLPQEQPATAPQDMQHMHHGGFMQGGMHHAVAKGVKLEQKIDGQAIVVRVGPMNLPAHTNHMEMPQPPNLIWQIPIDGWLLAYSPRLVDANGNSVPGRVLHHTAFWNENRSDFLCPNKEEHIFGAGSEMTNWAEVPGYGYRVHEGDKIRVETMVYNPTDTSYENVYLEVRVPYKGASSGANLKSVYPAWMDVKSCGDSGYDLPAGSSEKIGEVTVKYSGALLGVGGHMHDYARQLVLADVTRKETVAKLDAKVDDHGELISMPTVLFLDKGGYRFSAGDLLKISATYDNTTGKLRRDGAMGIVVGYFVPDDDSQMAALRRKVPSRTVAAASHDH